GRSLGGNVRLVYRLVRQHRLPGDVSDREDMRNVGPQLAIDRNESALVDDDTGTLGADFLSVRRTSDRDQHPVVELRRGGRLLALNQTLRPSFWASTLVTRVLSM